MSECEKKKKEIQSPTILYYTQHSVSVIYLEALLDMSTCINLDSRLSLII